MSELYNAASAQALPNADKATPVAEVKTPDAVAAPSEPKQEPKVEPAKEPEAAKPAEPAKTDDAGAKKDEPAKEEKKEESAEKKPDEPKPEIKYDLKLPDNSLLDQATMDLVLAEAKKHGLTNEMAQKIVDDQSAALSTFVDKQASQWLEQVKADKEIGGDNLQKSVAISNRLIEKFGSPALKTELSKFGYGNHPELIRFVVKLAEASGFAEDTLVRGGNSAPEPKHPAEVLYDKKPNKGENE